MVSAWQALAGILAGILCGSAFAQTGPVDVGVEANCGPGLFELPTR